MKQKKAKIHKTRREKRKLKAWQTAIIALLGAALLALAVGAAVSISKNKNITVAPYEISSSSIGGRLRVVLISDLHRKSFGEANSELVALTAQQQPDLICVVGDMLEPECTDEEVLALRSLFERLVEIAPVYFSAGNHDWDVLSGSVDFRAAARLDPSLVTPQRVLLEESGAVYLENTYRDIVVNGCELRIGGMYGAGWRTKYDTDESWAEREAFLNDFCATETFKLLLCHRPLRMVADECRRFSVDLVLSGHTHNGVICLPFSHKAILSPDEGRLFPRYDRGKYELGETELIIGGGLAGYGIIPRVFNPPEIPVVDIMP